MFSSPRLLLLLLLTASISCSSDAQRDSKLRLVLHRDRLLGSRQDAARSTLADLLLADLLQEENEELQEENEELRPPAEGGPKEVRADLERAAGGPPGPRESKAGCKNFFWKTFTSC
ncbi:somatostatin 1, tandem duplicate 1 [Brachionichthys hirsutus]|uniref:somatostatin 1, tandem duplicate 1 n=1 Tax=Brachionichthys hirsutus TaxID=412623 RepID=UPI0036049975